MAAYDIRPLQLRILKILLAIDQVCKEHGLRYYLIAGTLLGAVRHKGFIPWDDDLDIAMPRPDYETLMSHAKEWLPSPFEAKCAEIDPTYSGAFAKVIDSSTTLIEREHYGFLAGIYVDVFPLDGVPQNRLLQHWQMLRYKTLCKLIYLFHRDPYKHGHGLNSVIPVMVQKFCSHEGLQRSVRKVLLRYPYDKASLVMDYDDKNLRGVMTKEVIEPGAPIEFEGIELQGIAQPHRYLEQKYGDYMTVPDVEHQRQHNFFYLDYNLPYREYDDKRTFSPNHTDK